jgi:hypothetical protein
MSAEQDQRRHARLITHNDIASEEDIKPYSELSCYGKIKRYTPQRPVPALGLSFSGSFFTWAFAEILVGRVDNSSVQIFVPMILGVSSILPHAALARALNDYDSGCLSRIDDIESLPQSRYDSIRMLIASVFITSCIVDACKNSDDKFVGTFLPLLLGCTLGVLMQMFIVKTSVPCSQLMDGFKHDVSECCSGLRQGRLPWRNGSSNTPYPVSANMVFEQEHARRYGGGEPVNPLTTGFDGYQESKSDDERAYEIPGGGRDRSDAFGGNHDLSSAGISDFDGLSSADGLTKSNSWQKKSIDDLELGGSGPVSL